MRVELLKGLHRFCCEYGNCRPGQLPRACWPGRARLRYNHLRPRGLVWRPPCIAAVLSVRDHCETKCERDCLESVGQAQIANQEGHAGAAVDCGPVLPPYANEWCFASTRRTLRLRSLLVAVHVDRCLWMVINGAWA